MNSPLFKAFRNSVICLVIGVTGAYAQERNTEYQRAHFGLVYPLSTNGVHAASVRNSISFHALAGLSAGEDGFVLSGLSTIIRGTQSGVAISGLSNTIGAGASGVQIAGLVNVVRGNASGIQIAGLGNTAGSENGLQLAGLTNVSRNTATAQISGLVNVSKTSAIQIAGLSNVTRHNGVQIAGLVNTAENSNGQIAGLVNIAKKVKGIQFAGLINVAEESDCPIALINVIKKGEKQIGLTYDEAGNGLLAFRSGGTYTYSILGAGFNLRMPEAPYALEAGFGLRIPVSRIVRVNLELSNTANTNFWDASYYKSSLRPLIGVTLANRIELVVGPSFNYVNYLDYLTPYTENSIFSFYGAQSVNSLFIGAMGGLHLRF